MPALVLVLGSGRAVENFVIAQRTAEYELIARGLAVEYEQFLAAHQKAVLVLADLVADREPRTTADLVRLLEVVRKAYPAFWQIGIVDSEGRLVAAAPLPKQDQRHAADLDLSDHPWFRELSTTHRSIVARSLAIGDPTTPTMAVNAAIVDDHGRFRGAVTGRLDLAAVQALASDIRVGTTGYAQAATADGIALAHQTWDYVRERKDFSKLAIWPLVTAAPSGRITHYVGVLGDDRLAGYATVPGVGWKVWVNQARSEVAEQIRAVYRRVLMWSLLPAFIGIGIIVVLAAAVTRPLEALRESVTEIAAGATDRQIPRRGAREVAALADAFEEMVRRITAGQAALEAQLRDTGILLSIARVVGGTSDVTEALRLIARELAKLTGADTVAAYMADPARVELRPVAAYHVPKSLLDQVAATPIPLSQGGLRHGLFAERRALWTDNVAGEPGFAESDVVRRFPHQSAAVIPLFLNEHVVGGFYLV